MKKRGLAYAVYSFISAHVDTGMFGVYLAVSPQQALEAVGLVAQEIRKLADLTRTVSDNVSAVIKDIPAQSSLRFDAVVPFVLQFAPSFEEPTHWGGNPLETWALLAPAAEEAAQAKAALEQARLEAAQARAKAAAERAARTARGRGDQLLDAASKSAVRTMGNQVGRTIIRGILGAIIKTGVTGS